MFAVKQGGWVLCSSPSHSCCWRGRVAGASVFPAGRRHAERVLSRRSRRRASRAAAGAGTPRRRRVPRRQQRRSGLVRRRGRRPLHGSPTLRSSPRSAKWKAGPCAGSAPCARRGRRHSVRDVVMGSIRVIREADDGRSRRRRQTAPRRCGRGSHGCAGESTGRRATSPIDVLRGHMTGGDGEAITLHPDAGENCVFVRRADGRAAAHAPSRGRAGEWRRARPAPAGISRLPELSREAARGLLAIRHLLRPRHADVARAARAGG